MPCEGDGKKGKRIEINRREERWFRVGGGSQHCGHGRTLPLVFTTHHHKSMIGLVCVFVKKKKRRKKSTRDIKSADNKSQN